MKNSVLIIGSGSHGSYMEQALRDLYKVRMICGLDFDPENINFEESYVYVATPHYTHQEFTEKLLRAGKNVLCEKPLSLDVAGVTKLYDVAEEVGRCLRPGFVMPIHPLYQWIKDVQQIYGPVISIMVENNATESRIESEWYFDNKKSGGWFMTAEIHWYHLFMCITKANNFSVVSAHEVHKR